MAEISLIEVGQRLAEARESRNITLKRAEQDTRIRLKYLMAMEAGDFEALPNPVVARGFLRSYARYLGLDPEPLVEALQTALPESTTLLRPARREGPHVLEMDLGRPSGGGLTTLLSALLVVILVGIAAYWVWLQGGLSSLPFVSRQPQPAVSPQPVASPTPPSTPTTAPTATPPPSPTAQPAVVPSPTSPPVTAPPATVVPSTPTPTYTATPRPTVVLATPTPTPTRGSELTVRATLVDRTWFRVLVDGQLVEEGLFDAGNEFTWQGLVVEIRTGNAGGMKLVVNGEDLGVLGKPGEVQHWIFYLQDGQVIRVTPTPTPAAGEG